MNKQFKILILLAAALASSALAADSKSFSLKTYRNDQYGFEFRYPADMEVVTSSEAAFWRRGTIVEIVNHPQNRGNFDYAMTAISIRGDLTEQSCLPLS